MIYASTFLSHSSADKPLVEAVARELSRLGLIPWLDKNELDPGLSLGQALREAIRRQATVTVFLSPSAVASRWVDDELAVAIKVEKESGRSGKIMPVYIGDPLSLVSSHILLRNDWMNPDGDRVDRLGIVACGNQSDTLQQAQQIAIGLAQRVYRELRMDEQREVVIYLDQRGAGLRRGEPTNVPDPVRDLDAVGLVYRPDLGLRTQEETLYGDEWKSIRQAIESSLSFALGTPRWTSPKNIRVFGHAQLGLAYLLGRYFNRNTTAHLFCSNIDGRVFNNQHQAMFTSLEGGNSHCETSHPSIPSLPQRSEQASISLLLSTPAYVTPVLQYLSAQQGAPPLVWVQSQLFTANDQVMQYIADVVALLIRLREEHLVRRVDLYCGLPFHVVPLLAANLLHVVENVYFMEYRRDLQGKNPAPGDIYKTLCFS
jgi:TIR domain